jgi:hypothetical protein
MLNIIRLLVLASVTFGSTSANGGFVNGSFENPTVAPGTFTNFTGGSTAISGWTVVGVDSALVNHYVQNGITFQAQNGSNHIDLAGVASNSKTSGVTQNIVTQIGTPYELSFYVGSATDNNLFFASTVDVTIAGGPRMSFTNPTVPTDRVDWRLFTTSFTATSTLTSITFQNGSAANNFSSLLDNVSLIAVPEPSSIILFTLGTVAICVKNRRRSACRG